MGASEGVQNPFVPAVRPKGRNFVLVTVTCDFFFYQEESGPVVVESLSGLRLHLHQIPDVQGTQIVWGIRDMGVGGRKFRIAPGCVSRTLAAVSAAPEAIDVLDPTSALSSGGDGGSKLRFRSEFGSGPSDVYYAIFFL